MRFTLEISLGNDAMQTGEDIATALREVAEKVSAENGRLSTRGIITDINGNRVGVWELEE